MLANQKGRGNAPFFTGNMLVNYPTGSFVLGAGAGAGAGVDAAATEVGVAGVSPEPRILISLFKRLNQNGEPWAAARPVMRRPRILMGQSFASLTGGFCQPMGMARLFI
jgi:hypothetical protein